MCKKTYITLILVISTLCWVMIQCVIFFTPTLVDKAIKSTEHIVFVQNTNLESMPGVQILDANNSTFIVLRNEPNRIDVKWKDTNIFLKEPKCRVKKLDSPIVQVMAEINNKQYPVIIDSGFNMYLMVNDVTVIENELKIFPVETKDPAFAGLCNVEKIKIGDMTITNPQCLYMLGHYEKHILGQTKWKQSKIIFGLEMMRQFKYVLIDNISSQVEFSMESFGSEPNETWQHYQMSLEKENNNTRAMIEIPIAGEQTKIMLDTGADGCFSMSQNKWEEFSKKLKVIGETNGQAQMLHGWEDVKEITVEELVLGEKYITGAHIQIFSNNSKLGPDFFMLGMDCFKDTVIVLDFEHNLFWVRQATDLAANKKGNF
jgi:hypothetical protein